MLVRVVYALVAVPLMAWSVGMMATAAGTRHAFRYGGHRYYFELQEIRERVAMATMLGLLGIIGVVMALVVGLSVVL